MHRFFYPGSSFMVELHQSSASLKRFPIPVPPLPEICYQGGSLSGSTTDLECLSISVTDPFGFGSLGNGLKIVRLADDVIVVNRTFSAGNGTALRQCFPKGKYSLHFCGGLYSTAFTWNVRWDSTRIFSGRGSFDCAPTPLHLGTEKSRLNFFNDAIETLRLTD